MITRILYHVVYVNDEGIRSHICTGTPWVHHLMIDVIGDNPKVIMMVAWQEVLVMGDI